MAAEMHRQTTPPSAPWAAFVLRGTGQMLDIQLTTVRTVLQTQARTAAAFGWPDCSDLFDDQGAEQSVRQAISTSTEQVLHTTQRASEALADVQRQFGRLIQQQTANAAQNVQQGLEQLGAQADESLTQLCETSAQQTEQLRRTSESLAGQLQSSQRAAGEQSRQALQDSAQQGREALAQAGEAQRQSIEAAAAKSDEAKARRERTG